MKISLRILLKNRFFTGINLFGLIIGISSFIIIISWVRHELSFDNFYTNKDRLYQLTIEHHNGILDPNTPYAVAPMLAERFPEVEAYSPLVRLSMVANNSFKFAPDSLNPIIAYEPEVVMLEPGFFDLLDFKRVYGGTEELLGRPESLVISSRIASTYYPGINPVGQTVLMNNRDIFTISGVIDIPDNSSFHYDFFISLQDQFTNSWNWRDPSYLILKPDVDVENFRQKISPFVNDNNPYNIDNTMSLDILPIMKVHLAFEGTERVFVFSCIAFLLLILAALNYMNLASANYVNRINEAGIRKVLGAESKNLRKIVLTETIIIVIIATIISLFIAEIVMPISGQVFNQKIEIGYFKNPLVLLLICAPVIITLIIASAYPSALYLKGNIISLNKKTLTTGIKGQLFILLTVILQFTLTITLLISAFIVNKQINFAKNKYLGFSVENVIAIPINNDLIRNFPVFIERMEAHSLIQQVSAGQALPFDEDIKTNVDWTNEGIENRELFRYTVCRRNYPELFNIRAVQGRIFDEDIESDLDKYVINETAASLLNYDNPVGEYLTMWGLKGEIIGVVRDFHHVSLHKEIMPHIFNVNPRNYRGYKYVFIKMKESDNPEAIAFIRRVCGDLASGFPFSYQSLQDEADKLYSKDTMLVRIIQIFLVLTILLSILSIYGLAYHSVEKRTREITIRKVFGANLVNNLLLNYKKLIIQIGFSFIIAIPLSVIVMNKWLSNFAYKVNLKASYFVLALLISLFVALLTTTVAMWKTINKNPIDNLHQN